MSFRLAVVMWMSVTASTGACLAAEARWPQFRGPGGLGIADDQNPPTEFSPTQNLLWKIPIPRGHSCPTIWDERIFLTALDKGKLQTICINRADGKILWRQPAPVENIQRVTPANSPATPTCVTDGQRIYSLFGSYGLLAYDFDGKELWRKPLRVQGVRHGMGTSPILAAGKLIVNGDQEDMKSFLIAIDPATGQTLWQSPRPLCFSSHTTPVAWNNNGVDEVVIAGSIRLVAFNLADGSERWSCRGLEAISICPSPVLGDGTIYASSYSMNEKLAPFEQVLASSDKDQDKRVSSREAKGIIADIFSIVDSDDDGFITPQEWESHFQIFKLAENGLFAVRPGQKGDVTDANVLWKQKKGIPEISSALYYRGRIYTVRSGGMVSCYDAKTGTPLYESRRIAGTGQYYASPIAADGRIYMASMTGIVSVIAAGDEPKTLARNELGEAITATPAIADNKLYIRSADHLWAFGQSSK